MQDPKAILDYWIDQVGPEGWYKGGDALDTEITEKFSDVWSLAAAGRCEPWLISPAGALACLIVLDQFPRNMFRGTAKAFSTDNQARAVAKRMIDKNWDLQIPEPQRQFFYLPLMHSECLMDQERCVRLIKDRMPKSGGSNLLHAKAHREVIRRFGRFPFRNQALNREPSEQETQFLANGGYSAALKAVSG